MVRRLIPTPHGKVVDTGYMSIRRPPKPRLVRVHNTTGTARTYDTAGRTIGGGETRDNANANDPLTAALINERTLHVLEENK